MIVPVAEIDQDIAFLKSQRDYLQKRVQNPYWVQPKIDQFDRVIKHLQDLRREAQMSGVDGKGIE